MAQRGLISHGLGGIRSPHAGQMRQLALKREPQPQAPPPKPEPQMPNYRASTDSIYTRDLADLQRSYEHGLSGIATQRDRLGFDTGYTNQDLDGDGAADIDTRNPYSQAMALQKHYRESRRGTSVGMAARGQLYSGARKQALKQEDYRYSERDAGLREYSRRGYEDLTRAEQGLGFDLTRGQNDALANQTGRWEDQERYWYSLHAK
jgi:hypothetical protein